MKGKIFFLLIENRPKDFLPLKNFKGKFWHTGIIFDNQVYECFNFGRWKISGIERLHDKEFRGALFIETDVIENKVIRELKSGTDCAEYVARCIGISDLKSENKGSYWPEDIFNFLNEK